MNLLCKIFIKVFKAKVQKSKFKKKFKIKMKVQNESTKFKVQK